MMTRDKGVLTIISGFSGAGKGTVVKQLMSAYPDRFRLSISATTRKPREGEVHGVHYFFIGKDEFEKMVSEDAFLEHADFVKHSYGTPKKYVQEMMDEGYDVILEIEQQGAFQVKKVMPEALLIFLTPPTIDELEKRLRGRGTESEEQIQGRLSQAAIEAESIDLYDYIVINDDLDECVDSVLALIDGARSSAKNSSRLIMQFKNALKIYRKGE